MKELADLKSILKAGKLTNELDLERASILDNKLRLLAKDNPELIADIEAKILAKINQGETVVEVENGPAEA